MTDVVVWCDGAARGNPGPAGIGVAVTDAAGVEIASLAKGIGVATNNVAEYAALIEGLNLARSLGAIRVVVRCDSLLVVSQMAGVYKVKSPRMRELHAKAIERASAFSAVSYEAVPRGSNERADQLANQGIDAHRQALRGFDLASDEY